MRTLIRCCGAAVVAFLLAVIYVSFQASLAKTVRVPPPLGEPLQSTNRERVRHRVLRRRATSARALCLFPLRWATSTTLYLNVEQVARLNARSLYKEFHLDGKPDRRGEHQLQQRFDPAWRRDGQLYRTDQLLRKQARGATLAQASRRLYGPDSRLKVSDTPVAIHNRN